jgi:hypothetical protein
MVFPIIPQQQNNLNRNFYQFPNNRPSPRINRAANGNGIQQIIKNFTNSDSGSPITNLATKGLGNVSKTLSNVDQVIKVVQSATPIVREYGPMVKNLPAMYRMVKAFSQINDDENDLPKKENLQSNKPIVNEESTLEKKEHERPEVPGRSTPRMYI